MSSSMSFTGNLGVTHGGIFIAYNRGYPTGMVDVNVAGPVHMGADS